MIRQPRLKLTLCLTIFAIAIAGTSLGQEAPAKVLRAGAAMSNITPPLGELIVGGWAPFPAKHVHDELYARCLLLDDGDTIIGFVLCDNVGIPREVFDTARAYLAEETDLDVGNLLMSSTHTHSATTARGPSKVAPQVPLSDYQQFLARRIADGVRRALNELQPARIAWGKVDEPSEVFNRRWHVIDPELRSNPFGGVDQVRMNPPRGNEALVRPAGPVDPEVSFLSVQSLEGQPLALLANYSLHYVGGVKSGDISADYFGYFSLAIAERLGADKLHPPFVGMLSNGTSGDVNNINFRERGASFKPYEKMQLVANKLADRIMEVHRDLQWHDWVKLNAAWAELELEVRQPTPEMREFFAELAKRPADQRHVREENYAARMKIIEASPKQVFVPLQVLQLGDLAIHAIPFEVFTEIGLELKERSPFPASFTIELANGSYGYLPTPAQHALGGYETWLGSNYVQLDASDRIIETLMELSAKLVQH